MVRGKKGVTMWLKRFLFISVFFCLAFSPLFSQSKPETMTDAEIIQELMSNLEKREASIKKQEELLNRDRELLTQDQMIFENRKQLLTETEAYWKNYKKETLTDKIKIGAATFAAGFILGNISGVKIGIGLQD
jgi:hypothetical protein